MLPRFPVYKHHWFLIGLVFAFLVLISPVSADHTSPVGWPNVYSFYPNATYPDWNDLPGVMPGQTIYVYSDGSGIYGNSRLYFDGSGSICYDGSVNLGGAMSGSFTVITGSCNGTRLFIRENTGANPMVHMFAVGSANTGAPTAAFTGTPTAGNGPLVVNFTDQSTAGSGTISSRLWDFGDGENSTATNPSHTYASSGQYTVSLTATNSYGSDTETKTNYITVYAVPVASFSCSPTNSTSPDYVTCSDSSSGFPTAWLWQLTSYGVSMSPGGSYGAGVFSAVNSTQNPVFYMDGSGKVDVRLTVSNPGGTSQEYKPEYITISGNVPTPTSTPSVPWPNQTGVCVGSGITLGSGATRDHLEHFQLTSPSGDTFSGQYGIGVTNYVSGQPFFTAGVGQYVYQEYMYDSPHTLEWQQSYITQNCLVTTVPTTSLTVIPTPGTTTNPWGGNYPVVITYPTVPATLDLSSDWEDNINLVPATIATFSTWNATGNVNYTDIRNTISTSNPLMIPYLNFIDSLMVQPMYWYFEFLSMIITIQALIAPSVYAVSLFASMLNSLNQYLILTTVAMNAIVSNIPMEWQNYFSLCLVGDLIIYIWQLKSGRSI